MIKGDFGAQHRQFISVFLGDTLLGNWLNGDTSAAEQVFGNFDTNGRRSDDLGAFSLKQHQVAKITLSEVEARTMLIKQPC